MSHEEKDTRARNSVLIVVLAAIFVGLCTVLGEALVPRTLPPRGVLGWLAPLSAIALFAFTFIVTVMIAIFLGDIAKSIPRQPLREIVKESKESEKQRFRIAFAVISFAAVVLTIWMAVDPGKLIKDEPIEGGIDLARYCQSYGYDTNSEERCSWNIPLNKACDWQYRAPGHYIVMKSDPHSGVCHNSQGKRVGGISDMRGFCRDQFRMSTSVNAAVVNGKTWVCQIAIDKDLACSWQYLKGDLEARKVDGLWTCYQ